VLEYISTFAVKNYFTKHKLKTKGHNHTNFVRDQTKKEIIEKMCASTNTAAKFLKKFLINLKNLFNVNISFY